MARGGRRGGRAQQGRRDQSARPAQRQRQQGGRRRGGGAPGGAPESLPTAAPGALNAPAGASVFGAQSVAGPVLRPTAARSRGGPREAAGSQQHLNRRDRRTRARAAMHDFGYIPRDLRWVGITTGLSVALVLALWAAVG